jgi:formylmethanofuran dehydrogenase subunit B
MSSLKISCPACTCLCDDLVVDASSKKFTPDPSCEIATQWLERCSRKTTPYKRGNFDQQIATLVGMLRDSKAPLITGLENLTTSVQQNAVKVADRFACSIDVGFSDGGRDSMSAFQRYGKVTASVGEIANRSDVVVFWFCDPAKTHPRFVDRFLRNDSKLAKQIVVFDERKTATAELADEFVLIDSSDALGVVQGFRLALAEKLTDSSDQLSKPWIERFSKAQYGSVFVGQPEGTEVGFDAMTDQWFQLVRSLNNLTRFVMSSLPNNRNRMGANNVLASLSGFPAAVRYADGKPAFNGEEFSTSALIARQECDLLLVCDIGTQTPFEQSLDSETVRWLKTIPVIVLSDRDSAPSDIVDLFFHVTTPGWDESGDFMRLDDVPIPLRDLSTSEGDDSKERLRPMDVFEALLAKSQES